MRIIITEPITLYENTIDVLIYDKIATFKYQSNVNDSDFNSAFPTMRTYNKFNASLLNNVYSCYSILKMSDCTTLLKEYKYNWIFTNIDQTADGYIIDVFVPLDKNNNPSELCKFVYTITVDSETNNITERLVYNNLSLIIYNISETCSFRNHNIYWCYLGVHTHYAYINKIDNTHCDNNHILYFILYFIVVTLYDICFVIFFCDIKILKSILLCNFISR